MMQSEARVPTAMGARYLAQLCKHFAHRLTVTHEGNSGSIEFPDGLCVLTAQDNFLVMQLAAKDPETLDRLQTVMDKHLEQFAFREKPAITWQGDGLAA